MSRPRYHGADRRPAPSIDQNKLAIAFALAGQAAREADFAAAITLRNRARAMYRAATKMPRMAPPCSENTR